MKEQVFTSMRDIKVATSKIIADINNRKKSGFKQNRKELFEEYDRPNMKLLSPGMFTVVGAGVKEPHRVGLLKP